jgi:phosphatidylglycerol:prolipoprotein diacylglycerol transferase
MMPSAYGWFAAVGCVTGVLWLRRHREGMGVSDNEFWAAMWLLLLGGIVGAKAFFVVLGWEHYARGELRFWADFRIGFVFFGGLVGALVAGGVFAAVRRLDFVRGADYFAVALPMGHAIGRIGCFFAGCCYGRLGHPVQLYESVGLMLIALGCHRVLARIEAGTRADGDAFRLYLILYGGLRIFLDPLRADGRPERFLGISYQQATALLVILCAAAWQRWAQARACGRGALVRDAQGSRAWSADRSP